ncbi:MAG: hypothetical protein JWQ42_4965 [Edaphobacter sp.]|nr:hypothetical protein [Edaphobacter sp.]
MGISHQNGKVSSKLRYLRAFCPIPSMDICERLSSLLNSAAVSPRLLIVLAHPDDEVLAVGGRLERMAGSQFLCVTDGARLDGNDARDHGFPGLSEYRAARRRELLRAFELAGLDGNLCARMLNLKGNLGRQVSDRRAALQLAEITESLTREIQEFTPEAVLTHPYEGGHPDHDACSFAVHAAIRLLSSKVPLIEAPLYHAGREGMEMGVFLPGGPPASIALLSKLQQHHKHERLACFVSQSQTLGLFGAEMEQYRMAPHYNFIEPPHAGLLFYEGFRWGISGQGFCELAKAALADLGLPRADA